MRLNSRCCGSAGPDYGHAGRAETGNWPITGRAGEKMRWVGTSQQNRNSPKIPMVIIIILFFFDEINGKKGKEEKKLKKPPAPNVSCKGIFQLGFY